MKTAGIVLVTLGCAIVAVAQERIDPSQGEADAAKRVVILDPGLSLGRATLLFPSYADIGRSVQPLPVTFVKSDDLFTVPVAGGVFQKPIDLISPYRLQRQKKEELVPLMMVLGAVEAGAVGYMAYQHIRKYGFLK